jgi:hypothetical protein
MKTATFDADEMLKNLAAETVKQGENLRARVRDVTLGALRSRELSLARIRQVLKSVTQGVNLGAATIKINPGQVLEDALAGMDDALLKAVQANRLALQQLAAQGRSFRESHVKKALDDLERLEDEFLNTVRDASKRGGEQMKAQWAALLKDRENSGTATGAQVTAAMEQLGEQMRSAMRAQRRAAVKTAQVLSENFTTLASGILIGITEGLQQGKAAAPRRDDG